MHVCDFILSVINVNTKTVELQSQWKSNVWTLVLVDSLGENHNSH